jgi:hypothetical protein
MKKLVAVLVLISFSLSTLAQVNTDSILKNHKAEIEGVKKSVGVIQKSIDTIESKVSIMAKPLATPPNGCSSCEIGFWQWVLIFSPIWIFMLLLFSFRKKLKGFNLKEALSENELPKKTIPNPEYTTEKINTLATNANTANLLTTLLPPTIEVTASDEYPKSSSRYIAFITSVLTWVIGLCLTCFFIYQYMKGNTEPKLSGLSSVLLSLGIGVVPYAFNKISKAME